MSCLVKMRAVRDELSANELKIAEFILANSALIRDYSSQNLAASVGVSQSSIVKFSQKLGYKGFTDFKLAIHESVVKSDSIQFSSETGNRQSTVGESVEQQLCRIKCEALSATMGLNDEARILAAVKALETDGRIQIVAPGSASPVARNLASMLIQLGKWVVADVDAHVQQSSIASLGRGDVVFVISFSGQSTHTVELVRLAKRNGVTIASLTGYSANPIRSLSDIQLFAVGQDADLDVPQVISSLSQQHVIDMVLSHLVKRDKKGREIMARAGNAVASAS